METALIAIVGGIFGGIIWSVSMGMAKGVVSPPPKYPTIPPPPKTKD